MGDCKNLPQFVCRALDTSLSLWWDTKTYYFLECVLPTKNDTADICLIKRIIDFSWVEEGINKYGPQNMLNIFIMTKDKRCTVKWKTAFKTSFSWQNFFPLWIISYNLPIHASKKDFQLSKKKTYIPL